MRHALQRGFAAVLPAVAAVAIMAITPPAVAAETDWGGLPGPTDAPSRVIGAYARGCLDGAAALPLDGAGYQVMRPSRNRYYGHPRLIQFLEWAGQTARAQGWDGILVGDLAQPRGGPMRSGHASHQTGLDVDIWFEPAPPRRLSMSERETLSATSVLAADGRTLNRQRWTDAHSRLLRAVASHPDVARVFVNAAIKQHLCAVAGGDRRWLTRVRPWWGHDDHLHVRLACPAGEAACKAQKPPPPGDGCDATLAWWLSDEALRERQQRRAAAAKAPSKPMTLAGLPPQCAAVFRGPAAGTADRDALRQR